MKLGSLFDGSGGFPLAGIINGICPVWASEIEPYPLRVTAERFPNMKQLGDVTKIDGAAIEPVDVITFGSPCQDLSVAGKQLGIHEGERSNLFFEAIRIIREMRGATNGKYPRFAVWENVPGAFSSSKGKDFQAVLQAFCDVCGEAVSVPEPPKGKWKNAGCIVGTGYSIAWRTYDAQYWGVPQRRKRIYLVADFASERAGEILFERESMRGNPAPSREAREGTAADAEGSVGRGCGVVYSIDALSSNSMKSSNPHSGFHETERSKCLDTSGGNPMCNQGGNVVVQTCVSNGSRCGVFMGGQGDKAGGIAYSEDIAPTLRSAASGSDQTPDVVYAAGFADGLAERAQGGMEYMDGKSPTLRAEDVRAVVYDARGNGAGGWLRP